MTGLRPRVLVAEPEGFSPIARERLEQFADVELREIGRDQLAAALASCDVFWFRLRHRLDRALIEQARCRVIATAVTGLDHVDLDACRERGIRVVSLRGETAFLREVRATAEHTVALTLALLRNLPAAVGSAREGRWDRVPFRGHELHRKTAGIVGMGRLGSIVAGYFRAFGMHVLGTDPRADFPLDLAERVSLEELLERSDVVSLHVSYGPSTRRMIGEPELARMQPHAVLINTARGGVVDEGALARALESGRIAGAALDVLDGEPDIPPSHPLIQLAARRQNLLLTPHIGGNTFESFDKTETFLAERVRAALEGA